MKDQEGVQEKENEDAGKMIEEEKLNENGNNNNDMIDKKIVYESKRVIFVLV